MQSKLFRLIIFLSFVITYPVYAGTLSCTVRASACNGGETAIWKMSGTSNAHAELPAQQNYSQVVCCSGVAGLGNSCSGTFATALKLSATTNGHAEQNSQSNYAQSACIQAPGSGTVSVGYQASNCTGFDTTLGSMSGTTNAHVGDSAAYTTKICATAAAGGVLSVDIVDAAGTPVTSPTIAMAAKTILFTHQMTNGTFGASAQKIRVENNTGTATWSLTLAASSGSTALWSAGTPKYDFNDATASAGDGGDADSSGGQMTLTPTGATLTPEAGCSNTGVSLGSSASFVEGTTNSLTLLSAGSSAGTSCYWDLTGVGVVQSIPSEQVAGNYSINLTLTVTAS